jgi:DNA repair protein RadC
MLIEAKEELKQKKITNPKIAADIFRNILLFENEVDQDKEHFWVIGLNTKNIILYVDLVSLGTLNSSLSSPREVFRMAIFKAAASIMAGHNHPSGDLSPSYDDKRVTQQLEEAGRILGISLLDHIIICKDKDSYYSLGRDRMFRKTQRPIEARGEKKRGDKAS